MRTDYFSNYLLSKGFTLSKRFWGYALVCLFALLLIKSIVRINYTGQCEGIFLLKGHGKGDALYVLKDDLYLNEGYRLVYALDLQDPKFVLYKLFNRHKPGTPYLYYEWDKKDGSGFVRNILPGGKQVLTCFGRFLDDDERDVHGLFVGGGLPEGVIGNDVEKMNETGMAYYDGKDWFHVWCTSNEDIEAAPSMLQYYPSSWKYLGSEVLHANDEDLLIRSRHEVVINGVPLRVDRYVSFKAGSTYFILSIRITNMGARETGFSYTYADEPWLGHFGSSKGNVGWVKGSLVKYTGWLDSKKYSYTGFFDYGNDAAGEKHNFTGIADFLEWYGSDKPSVFFSNGADDYPSISNKEEPLSSDERFLCLQWGPETLLPGESLTHVLAVGMAGNDPKTGFPVKPDISLARFPN
jgi:hypothetical protein